jgi:hypothetical protein
VKKVRKKRIIGRRERVDFPELGLYNIEAKIDTGAYTTALHCHDILFRKDIDGKEILCFKLLDPSHPNYNEKQHCFTVFEKKQIKNSFGDLEERFVIKEKIKMGNKTVRTSISLTDRGNMKYPVLIGRRFLKGRFVIDVSQNYLIEKKK